VLQSHSLDHLGEASARPDRAWPQRHRLLGRDVLFRVDDTTSKPAEDDAPVIDDEAGIPAAVLELLANGLQAVVQAAGRNVSPEMSPGARLASVSSLEG